MGGSIVYGGLRNPTAVWALKLNTLCSRQHIKDELMHLGGKRECWY
jgi:hypothetical protein